GKGIWNGDTIGFIQTAIEMKKPVFVDPSRQSPLALYRGATLMTPNLEEAEKLCGFASVPRHAAGSDSERLTRMAQCLLEKAELQHAFITCGAAGMVALSSSHEGLLCVPTFARDVFDVTGAGDTV